MLKSNKLENSQRTFNEHIIVMFQEQVVFPNVAQNKEDKWLYVVNQDSHVQGVRVEKCV